MTREEARKAAEVMLAYADGKEIEYLCKDGWRVTTNALFNWNNDANYYRIKPEPKYRPFKNAEECWLEMQKHQPFGWVKDSQGYVVIQDIWNDSTDGTLHIVIADTDNDEPNILIKDYTFADGEPFGVKEV